MTSTTVITTEGNLKKAKIIPTYALLPHTELLPNNMGYLCTGWDAFAPRFLMTDKFYEMLEYLASGRRCRITIPTDFAIVDDLLLHVGSATRHAAGLAAKKGKESSLYYYTHDESVGNFRQVRVL